MISHTQTHTQVDTHLKHVTMPGKLSSLFVALLLNWFHHSSTYAVLSPLLVMTGWSFIGT